MSWRLFIVELTKALAWPAGVVVGLLILRQHLKTLVGLISKVKYGNLEVELSDVEKQLRTSSTVSAVQVPRLSEYYIHLANVSPSAVILEAWKELEVEILEGAKGLEVELHQASPILVIARYFIDDKIDEAWRVAYAQLSHIRDSVGKGEVSPTATEALRFVETAEALKESFKTLRASGVTTKLNLT